MKNEVSFSSCSLELYKHVLRQDHYPAVDRERVRQVMGHMVQAGRLQQVPNCPALVRMGGVVQQLSEQKTLPIDLHDEHHDDGDGLHHDGLAHNDEGVEDTVIDEKASFGKCIQADLLLDHSRQSHLLLSWPNVECHWCSLCIALQMHASMHL